MTTKGFVKTERSDLDVIGRDGALKLVWDRICEWAAWGRRTYRFHGQALELEPGQLVAAEEAIASSWDLLTRKIVRRCLARLERLGWIVRKPLFFGATRRAAGSLITVVKRDIQRANCGPAKDPIFIDESELPKFDGPIVGPVTKKSLEEEKNNLYPPPFVAGAREGEEDKRDSLPPPEEREPRCGDPPPDLPSAEEVDLVRYAQAKLCRLASAAERTDFVELVRESVWLTPEAIKRNVDWIASHPMARRDTVSIKRVFFVEQQKALYRSWDDRLVSQVCAMLADDMRPPEIAEHIAARLPTCDYETSYSYALGMALRYVDQARGAARL
jgi:hypothetical protein